MAGPTAFAAVAPRDHLALEILRFVIVTGCATALIMARHPLPF